MNYIGAKEFLESKTKEELVGAFRFEYLEWKRTGILSSGLIRDLYNILNDADDYLSVTYAEKMFNEHLAELYFRENR